MPLTGVLGADFSSFYLACRQAEVSLQGFEGNSRKVEVQLDRMVNSFTGKNVIAEATMMAEAVGRIGGPARLSQADLAHVGSTAGAAAETFRRWGQEVPPNIARLEAATRSASGGMTSMAKAVAETDNVLGLFGVELGPVRRALDDLGASGAKTVTQLGFIGTASLAAGAALGGWQIGRKIAELGDLDTKIGDATAKMLGWGDVAGEKAAAKADMLAKASKEVGFQVTTLSTAMAVNEAAALAMTEANKKASEQFVKEREAAKDLAAEIDRVYENNKQKILDAGKQLQKAAEEREAAEKAAAAGATEAMWQEIDATSKAQEKAHELGIAFEEAQAKAKAKTDEATAALEKQAAAAAAANRALGSSFDIGSEAGARAFLATPEQSLGDFIRTYNIAGAQAPLDYIARKFQEYLEARRRAEATLGLKGGGAAGGLANLVGGLPTIALTNTVNLQVSGVLDPRTKEELTNAIGQTLIRNSGAKVAI